MDDDDDDDDPTLLLLLFPTVLSPSGTTAPPLLDNDADDPEVTTGTRVSSVVEFDMDEERPASIGPLLLLLLLPLGSTLYEVVVIFFVVFPPVEHGHACPHITQHLIPSGMFGHGLLLICPGKFTKLLNSGMGASLYISISP